jgi:hypothetical protein
MFESEEQKEPMFTPCPEGKYSVLSIVSGAIHEISLDDRYGGSS